jgi:L-lysine exporter family protein LysE/ArgO
VALSHVLFLLVLGLGLGLGAAVPIGPVNVEIARRTLARGRAAGMALGFGAVTVDVLFAVGTSLGAARLLERYKGFAHGFGYAGVAVCFVLAAGSFFAARHAYKHGVDHAAADRPHNAKTLAADYAAGFAMTALNIYTWVWWFVAVPAVASQHGATGAADLPILCLGVAVAASGWVVGFTTIINKLRRFAGRSWHIGADLVGGVALLGFGFWTLWRLVGRPL